jgi:hypothetical protein
MSDYCSSILHSSIAMGGWVFLTFNTVLCIAASVVMLKCTFSLGCKVFAKPPKGNS